MLTLPMKLILLFLKMVYNLIFSLNRLHLIEKVVK